jgi:ribonucleoside-diphosphate reductase alpha chain
MKKTLEELKKEKEAPKWMTEEAWQTLSNGYLPKNESTPNQRAWSICLASANRLGKPELAKKFYSYYEKRWLGFSSPIWANMGTTRGLPISCFGNFLEDNLYSIMDKNTEVAMLTKSGGGVSSYFGNLRGKNASIRGNGKSEGIIPWAKIYDSTILGVSQGGTRKGANAIYLDIDHEDFYDFLRMRRQVGDVNRQCLNSNHAICISDDFMERLNNNDPEARNKWKELLVTRFETGEPYMFFTGNVNKHLSKSYNEVLKYLYPNTNLVKFSNICTEITQYCDSMHTFVCCLSSANLSLWNEWKDTDFIYYMTWFLDGVMQEFIDRSENQPGLEHARRSAIKGRALGVGGMGWHTLLQKLNLSFESLQAKLLNTQIWKYIDQETLRATIDMGKELGEPEWCKGTGHRNTLRMAIAPTVSNSTIMGSMDEDLSASVEPIPANAYAQKSAKGTFIRKNKLLEKLLKSKKQDNTEVWKSIVANEGSVSHLEFLTEEEKQVFLTAREINQFVIIRQASDRQKYIDQAQSINLFFTANATPKYMSDVAKEAWREGLKTLYYCRTSSVLKADSASRGYERKVEECVWCEG